MLSWLLLGCAIVSTAFSAGEVIFTVGQKYQIVLSSVPLVSPTTKVVPTDAAVYDIDLFDSDIETISGLKAQGHIVICYFSAGTYENWRPDISIITAADKGSPLVDWPDENWLRPNSTNVRKLASGRITLAAQIGCDAVDPDNMGM